MLKKLLAAIALATAVWGTTAPAQTLFRPVAIVNDSAITGYDLAQRAQILVALGFPAASTDALRGEAMDRLIDDRLKMQEAKRQGLKLEPEHYDEGLKRFAENAGQSPDELMAVMSAQGVTRKALDEMIGAEIVWQEVIRSRFGRRVEPGEAEIDAEIALMAQRGGVSYRVAEVGLPMNDRGRSDAETQALADRLSQSLNAGGDFAAAVKTYSRSPTAARGGEIGWLPGERLPPALAEEIASMEIGQVSRPIPVAGGLSLLKLLEKRSDGAAAIDAQNQELRERIRGRLTAQQSARLADGLLQELRRDAQIELR